MTHPHQRPALLALPAGLSEPLHILEPAGCSLWFWLLVAALVYFLWRRLKRWMREATERQGQPLRKPGAGRRAGAPAARIKAVRRKAHQTGDYRAGCHALTGTLRELLEEGRLGSALPTGRFLTARELAAELGDSALTALFLHLAMLRFARLPPTSEAFDDACEQAVDVVARKGWRP